MVSLTMCESRRGLFSVSPFRVKVSICLTRSLPRSPPRDPLEAVSLAAPFGSAAPAIR